MPEVMSPPKPLPEVPITRMETSEEIQAAIRAAAGRPADDEPPLERPLQRPPVALLCVIDDGKADGEWVRLRADRHVMGRLDGDIRIPHDALMSAAHAELVREKAQRGYHWVLNDLGSTNGTWVRIGTTRLKPGHEIIVGRARFRFEGGDMPEGPEDTKSTRPWRPDVGSVLPSLVEMAMSGPGERIPLSKEEYWIGRDPGCAIRRDDVLVSPKHARLYRDPKGRWHIENNKSLNGLWFRLTEKITLAATCQFRLGEQRFLFRVS